MPKIGKTKATKSFTLTMSTLAWLDEYCIRTGKKMSAVIDQLINDKRKQLESKHDKKFWCTPCGKNTEKDFIDNKPYCKDCGALDHAILKGMKYNNYK